MCVLCCWQQHLPPKAQAHLAVRLQAAAACLTLLAGSACHLRHHQARQHTRRGCSSSSKEVLQQTQQVLLFTGSLAVLHLLTSSSSSRVVRVWLLLQGRQRKHWRVQCCRTGTGRGTSLCPPCLGVQEGQEEGQEVLRVGQQGQQMLRLMPLQQRLPVATPLLRRQVRVAARAVACWRVPPTTNSSSRSTFSTSAMQHSMKSKEAACISCRRRASTHTTMSGC